MFLEYVHIEAMRHSVEVVAAYTADEAVALQVLLHRLQLVSQFTKGVDDKTCRGAESVKMKYLLGNIKILGFVVRAMQTT